jgi:hypothetical protein
MVEFYLVIYLTFDTRISIFKFQVPLWQHVSVLIYHLQAIFKCLPEDGLLIPKHVAINRET